MAEGVISTDIDKIINILKKKRKISLNDLAKESDTSASLLEKWLPILEEEGLIDISYHLTRVYISWTGEDGEDFLPISKRADGEFPVDVYPEQYRYPSNTKYPLPKDIEAPEDKQEKEDEQENDIETDTGEVEPKLRKLPSSSLKGKSKKEIQEELELIEKRKVNVPIEKFELPKNVRNEFNIPKGQVTSPSDAIKRLHPEIRLPGEVSKLSVKQKSSSKGIKIKPLTFDVEQPRKTKLDARAQKIKTYMGDINKARDNLEKLKIEKRKLFRETYEPIEKKFTSELETISDRISDKEEKILQLQQKILLLPGVIEEVDRQQLKLKEIEEEARKTFDDASITINESLGDLSELETQANEQMRLARENINTGIDESGEMNSVLTRIGTLEVEVRNKLNNAKQRLEEEEKRINSLETSLQKLEGIREKASDRVEDVVNSVESQKQKIMDLQKEVFKIGEIQHWVAKHKEEYGNLIDEFGEQIKENEIEYNKLREAIETNFVKKYVEDLDQVSKGYKFELDQAREVEQNIDTKIDLTKQKISDLLRKSREIVEAFESSEKEEPINVDIETLQNRESQILQRVQSKEQERQHILETLKEVGTGKKVETIYEPEENIEKITTTTKRKTSKVFNTKIEKPESTSTKIPKQKKKKEKILTYSEFLSKKRSDGLNMKQISRAWKKYKKDKKDKRR